MKPKKLTSFNKSSTSTNKIIQDLMKKRRNWKVLENDDAWKKLLVKVLVKYLKDKE